MQKAGGVKVAALRRELIDRDFGTCSLDYRLSVFSDQAERVDAPLAAALALEYLGYVLGVEQEGTSSIRYFGEQLQRFAQLDAETRTRIIAQNSVYENFFATLDASRSNTDSKK